jgi:N-carbamoyl-L-amino-acid hydrolase
MIFICNDKGSHNPDEAMELDDFMQGTRILTRWLAQNA